MAKKKRTTQTPSPDLSHIAEDLRGFAVPIDSIEQDPANERRHDEANLQAIAASLKTHGQVNPLVVNDRNNQVVIGNGRLRAAQSLGWTHIAVIRKPLTDAQQRSLRVADNRTAELADWDAELLQHTLEQMAQDDEEGAGELYDALLLDDLYQHDDTVDEEVPGEKGPPSSTYQVIVECADQKDRERLLKQLRKENRKCHAVTWT